MMKEPSTVEDALFRKEIDVGYKGHSKDRLNEWLDKNTPMGGKPPSYDQILYELSLEDGSYAEEERIRRYIYKAYQGITKDFETKWQFIGDYEVDSKHEVLDIIEKLEKKYNGEIKLNFYKSNW